MEEIDEQILSAKVDLASATAKDSEQQKNERKKAMAIRDVAMNTWAKSKVDAEVKKQEVALRQQELALQQKRQEQFEAQMLHQQQHLQQQALQQQQQFNLQQQQSQQTKFNSCFIAKNVSRQKYRLKIDD